MKKKQDSIPYFKFSGCGNEFILFDNRKKIFPYHNKKLIHKITCRKEGLAADGVVLLECSEKADAKFRIFNSDGSEAEMCGNGIRCLFKFLLKLHFCKRPYRIETMNDIIRGEFVEDDVKIYMSNPKISKEAVLIDGRQFYSIHTGVPHAIHFTDSLEKIDIKTVGPSIRYHPIFQPHGTNVTFVEILQDQKIRYATYERGVEGETRACGTGATAAALGFCAIYQVPAPISTYNKENECLIIDFTKDSQGFKNVSMTGPANEVQNGTFSLSQEGITE